MKLKLSGLSQKYVTALRQHLEAGHGASSQPALRLGRQAVALKLETLDLARIHERAVASLESSKKRDGFVRRAEVFFTEALTPIVETHRAARQNKLDLNRVTRTLKRRTRKLATANRQLQRGIVRRKN